MSKAISNLQNGKQVLVVAISGPSSSGKSTLASLLGIIFQSNSENKSTSMYSTFYSTIIFQNIHILFAWRRTPNAELFPICPEAAGRRPLSYIPKFTRSQQFFHVPKIKESLPCLRPENPRDTINPHRLLRSIKTTSERV
jgi:hypothetical protein